MVVLIVALIVDLLVNHNIYFATSDQIMSLLLHYVFCFLIIASTWIHHYKTFRYVSKTNDNAFWINSALIFITALVPGFTVAYSPEKLDSFVVSVYVLILVFVALTEIIQIQSLRKVYNQSYMFTSKYESNRSINMQLLFYIVALIVSLLGFPLVALLLTIVTIMYGVLI